MIADTEEQVISFMEEGIYDYAASFEWIARNSWEGDEEGTEEDWYESKEYEDYFSDCYFDFWEATEDDIENWSVSENDWEDIR